MRAMWNVVLSLTVIIFLSGCIVPIDKESIFPGSPDAAENLSVAPASPSNNVTPTISGTAKAEADLKLFSARSCKGSQVGSGTVNTDGTFALTAQTLSEGSYEFSVQVTANKKSSCSTYVPYVIDLSPPTVRFTPPTYSLANSSAVPVQYFVTFMGAASANLQTTDIILNKTSTADCSSITVANGTTLIATVSVSGCTGNGTIGISVAAGVATDNVGNTNAVSGASSVFNVDNSGITSVVYDPAAGTYDSVPSSITITFPEIILGTSVTASDFSVGGTCATAPSLILTSAIGSAATVSLSGGVCTAGQTAVLTTNLAGIRDAAGNAGSGTPSVNYLIDNVGPTSVTFNPVTARRPAIPSSIDLTFNEPVDALTVNPADFNITGTCATLPSLSVTQASGTTATVSLSGAVCNLDETVELEINLSGIDDLLGNAGSGSFSETYIFDNIGPAALSINPVTASVPAVPSTVVVIFDELLRPASVTASDLAVAGTCSVLPTPSVVSVNGGTITFGLAGGNCTTGQTIIVTVNGPSVTDIAGNAGSGSVHASYTFDGSGPVLSTVAPASGSVNSIPNTVSVFFNEALLPSSVDAADLSVSGTCGTLPTASFISLSGSTVAFGLSGAVCANGESVVVTMNGADITDAAGNPGSGIGSATYTIESVGPAPLSISPNTTSTQTMPAVITVTFDKSVLATSVSASDLNISGDCSSLPTVSVGGVSGAVVTFNLAGGVCADGESFFASIAGADVTDAVGNAGGSSQIVAYTKDTTGPAVLSYSPTTQSLTAVPNLVNIAFSESLLAGSVSSADFSVTGNCSTLPVAGLLSVSGQQVLVGISGAVCADAQYFTVTVNKAGISDLAGNAGAGSDTVTYTLDNSGPTLLSANPNGGSPAAVVYLNFSESLDAASVALNDFSLGGTCTTASLSLTAVSNDVVELGLSGIPCASGETVEITVDASLVKDNLGNAGSGAGIIIFTEP